jgi:glycerophosphoryl diester phosphodiesterase
MDQQMITALCSGYLLCESAAIAVPEVIAHRGASHDAPENTIFAFNLAWQQGADGVEGDFYLTKDGEIVCFHDITTKRMTGQTIRVAKSTLVELRQLDVGSWKGDQWHGARIPTIDEVFATVPEGKKVFIEIKCGPEILPVLKIALAKSKLQPGQTVIISFDTMVIAETKRQIPQLKALWLADFKTDKNSGIVSPSAKEILATLEKIGADGVSCNAHTIVDQLFMKTLRTAHKEVHMWAVDNVASAKRLLRLGVDSCTTNRAGWLKQLLRSEAERTELKAIRTRSPNHDTDDFD